MRMNKLFKTTDYNLTVTLCSLGFTLASINKTTPQRCIFQFENSPEIEKYAESYFRGEIKLDPRIVLIQAKFVKNRLHGSY